MIEPLHSYNVHDRLIALSSIELLHNLEREMIIFIAENTRYLLLKKGQVLFSSLDADAQVAFVLQGSAAIKVDHNEIEIVSERGTIGLESIFLGEEFLIEAVAVEPCLVLQLSTVIMSECFEQNSTLLQSLRAIMSRKLLHLHDGLPKPDDYEQKPATLTQQMTDVDKIIELRSNGLLAHANINAVIDLARRANEIRYGDGDILWRQGAMSNGMIRCIRGEIICENESGQVVVGPGFVVGALDTNANVRRAYTAKAKGDLIVLHFRNEDMLLTLETHVKLAFDLIRLMMLQRINVLLK